MSSSNRSEAASSSSSHHQGNHTVLPSEPEFPVPRRKERPCSDKQLIKFFHPRSIFQPDLRLRNLWQNVHVFNGATFEPQFPPIKNADIPTRCTFKGCIGAEFAYTVPISEQYVFEMILWLRKNGILSSKFKEAEKWKFTKGNMIPLESRLAKLYQMHVLGLVIMPTEETLKDLIELGEHNIAAYATPRYYLAWPECKGDMLSDGWKTEPTLMYEGLLPVPLFDCTIILIDDKSDDAANYPRCNPIMRIDRIIPAPTSSDPKATNFEYWTWTQRPLSDGKVVLPHIVCKTTIPEAAISKVSGDPQSPTIDLMPECEPKLRIPINPVPHILMNWKMLHQLKSQGGHDFTPKLTRIMDLADYYLKLSECHTPWIMWDRLAAVRPGGLGHLPPKPAYFEIEPRKSAYRADPVELIRAPEASTSSYSSSTGMSEFYI